MSILSYPPCPVFTFPAPPSPVLTIQLSPAQSKGVSGTRVRGRLETVRYLLLVNHVNRGSCRAVTSLPLLASIPRPLSPSCVCPCCVRLRRRFSRPCSRFLPETLRPSLLLVRRSAANASVCSRCPVSYSNDWTASQPVVQSVGQSAGRSDI